MPGEVLRENISVAKRHLDSLGDGQTGHLTYELHQGLTCIQHRYQLSGQGGSDPHQKGGPFSQLLELKLAIRDTSISDWQLS